LLLFAGTSAEGQAKFVAKVGLFSGVDRVKGPSVRKFVVNRSFLLRRLTEADVVSSKVMAVTFKEKAEQRA